MAGSRPARPRGVVLLGLVVLLALGLQMFGVFSLLLAFVATLYPSWRASRVNPAEALRYE